jgi:uncharacterized protein (TIGR04255 family)
VAKYSGRLTHPPIVYALCSVRFPTVGAVDEEKAVRIHSELKSEFPSLDSHQVVEFPTIMQGESQGSAQLRQNWFIQDREKRSGFIVESRSIAYRTTSYLDFDHFVSTAKKGIDACMRILQPALIERVGLRFVDLIESTASSPLEKYLEPALHGYRPAVPGLQLVASQQYVIGKSKQGDLLFRLSRSRHLSALAPDLMDPTIAGLRVPDPTRESVIVDIDHFKDNAGLDPSIDQIEQYIRTLQEPMSQIFKDAVTQLGCDEWNK